MFMRSTAYAASVVVGALMLAVIPAPPVAAQSSATTRDTVARAQASDTIAQSPGMQEFEARRRRGGGRYLTWAQVRPDRNRSLGEILVAHFPGIRVVYGAHLNAQFLVSTRGEGSRALMANSGPSLCYVQVFVDGSFIEDGDISWISPNNVAGLELYDATRTPPAYRRPDGQCGVLLVWLRSGT